MWHISGKYYCSVRDAPKFTIYIGVNVRGSNDSSPNLNCKLFSSYTEFITFNGTPSLTYNQFTKESSGYFGIDISQEEMYQICYSDFFMLTLEERSLDHLNFPKGIVEPDNHKSVQDYLKKLYDKCIRLSRKQIEIQNNSH